MEPFARTIDVAKQSTVVSSNSGAGADLGNEPKGARGVGHGRSKKSNGKKRSLVCESFEV